jgi:hypothetical protein
MAFRNVSITFFFYREPTSSIGGEPGNAEISSMLPGPDVRGDLTVGRIHRQAERVGYSLYAKME